MRTRRFELLLDTVADMIQFLWIQKYEKKHKCTLIDCKILKDIFEIILVYRSFLKRISLSLSLTRRTVMSVAVPIPALASVSVLQSAAVGGSVVGVVGPL